MKLGALKLAAPGPTGALSADESSGTDIAIIGIGGRWPLADDPQSFWVNIREGQDCIRPLPTSRRSDAEVFSRAAEGDVPPEYFDCGFLEDIDLFDPPFFAISPEDAVLMDPQQRLFLEVAHEAIEDGGYGGARIRGSKTGVFVGMSNLGGHSYMELVSLLQPTQVGRAVSGNLPALMSSRVSYTFDLHGPSVVCDTTCSSSLVALYQACKALRDRDCDMALVGASRVYVLPSTRRLKMGMESSTGRTRTFDDRSDGTGQGEGSAAVLLKPLKEALRDRDPIHAVIKGVAANHDGRSIGYKLFLKYSQKEDGVIPQDIRSGGVTVPSSQAQAEVIEQAWRDGRVDPRTIDYIEVHGTGTKVGDPVEIDGLTKALGKFTDRRQYCAIGTVKTNIGHLYDASGMASLVKVVMMLKNGQIPASLNFEVPNRKIDFIQSPVYFNTKLRSWTKRDHPRRAGMSIFGFSGTNTHVVLEEAPASPPPMPGPVRRELLSLSARSPAALRALALRYKAYLDAHSDVVLQDFCHTHNTGRGHYEFRVTALIESVAELSLVLDELTAPRPATAWANGQFSVSPKGQVTFRAVARAPQPGTDSARREANDRATALLLGLGSRQSPEDLEALSQAYLGGSDPDWQRLAKSEKCYRLNLPTYPLERVRCWVQKESI